MIEVEVKYKRRRVVIEVPESWMEVQIEDAPVLLTFAISLKDGYEILAALDYWLPKKTFKHLNQEAVDTFAHLMSWYEGGPSAEAHIPYKVHDGVKYYMPLPKFADGYAADWPFADEYYEAVVNEDATPEVVKESLIMLSATLYREREDDKRVHIESRRDIERRAEMVRTWDDVYLFNAFYYFAGCKTIIAQIYGGTIFKSVDRSSTDEDDDEELYNDNDDESLNFGWWGRYINVAETGVFGDYANVCRSNFHTICYFISMKYKEAEDARLKHQMSTMHDD